MSNSDPDLTREAEHVRAENERSLNALSRAIQFSQGQFSLILVRCNYRSLRDRLIQGLQEICPVPVQTITLPESAKTLFTTIQKELEGEELGGKRREACWSPVARDPLSSFTTQNSSPSPPLFPAAALFILGLESVTALDSVLISANQVRDEFPKHLKCPLVLWVNDWVLQKLNRLAPDFKSWAGNSVIDFEMAIVDLIDSLRNHTNQLFADILNSGDEQFPPNWAAAPPTNSLHRTELEFALNRIIRSGYTLDPSLRASIDFLLGQEAHSQTELETARQYYERSLEFWQSKMGSEFVSELRTQNFIPHPPTPSIPPLYPPIPYTLHPAPFTERAACVLVYLGLLWRSNAVLQRAIYQAACRNARNYFQQSRELFEHINRQDLIAKFITAEAEVLQKLGLWDELEDLAKKALVLHKLYKDLVRQARDHGFLAEVAIARTHWAEAKHHLEAARRLLEAAEDILAEHDQPYPHLETSLEIANRYHSSWYLLLLAKAEAHLGQRVAAIAHLEEARDHTFPRNDPLLYIQILETLRHFYYDDRRYLEAFRTKQLQRSLEQQYGFRAFVGALRLEAQQPLVLPHSIDTEMLLAQEIAASGRQQDVNRLIARLGRNDYKLTVIHGPSGVGKSSIVSAGLIPALKERVIGDRVALPILLNVYNDWQTALANKLEAIRAENQPPASENQLPTSDNQQPTSENQPQTSNLQSPTSGNQLQNSTPHPHNSELRIQNSKLNHPSPPSPFPPLTTTLQSLTTQFPPLLPVLIFDQFEEFFFVYETIPQRLPFYNFLSDCINLPYVKVILCLREDYLHYLLEFQRLTNLDIINNDILSKEIRYPLGDFSPKDARSVIKSLSDRAQFYMEDELIDALVHDLATGTNEVRPIELQVVGAQLQAEGINTLAEYRQKGPKEKLVERSLESVVHDCGPENEDVARIVLFLLTNENGTRPLKTKEDLEADLVDLGMTHDIAKLDLVLEVLVGSGLAFEIPEMPASLYQLVHDYLVSFIRNHYKTGLLEELEREQERRKLVEEKLNTELKQRLAVEEKLNLELKQRLQVEQERNAVVQQQLDWSYVAGAIFVGFALLAGVLLARVL
ncbi:MAG: hypothetical protein K6T90_13135 [Leptolyngbyaceae cyanobacterium HOT.MB2.61]|jgi:tetratricopeptide (TPR) repeat protein|nr:hypothetical protein [Leptolyngbyaceae cyanobacterium HOT.MB2.61]